MINRKKKIGLYTAIIFICLVTFIYFNVKLKLKIIIKNNNKSISFCDVDFFGKSVLINTKEKGLPKLNLLDKDKTSDLKALYINKKVNILYGTDKIIDLYSTEGKKLTNFKVSENRKIVSFCTGDVDGDGTDEILEITGNINDKFGDEFLVLKPGSTFKEIYKKPMKDLKPWKVQICDVDGDGKTDISIGTFKTTPFHPEMAKRPFIYNWEKGFISPKWLGSRLSQPFDDYVFCDIDNDGMDEIEAIEITSDSKKIINTYKWKGFGVEQIASGDEYEDIKELTIVNNEKGKAISARVKENSKWRRCKAVLENGKIMLNNENGFINSNVYKYMK